MNMSSFGQKGFTLLELIVALALGLLLTAAAIQIFTGGLVTSRIQQANADLQNSGVFGLDYVAHDVRLANYINVNFPKLNEQTPWGGVVLTAVDATSTEANLPIPTAAPFISKGLLSHSIGTGDDLSSSENEWQGLSNVDIESDQLTIQFVAPNDMVNCEGLNVQANDYVIQRYFLRRADANAKSGNDYGLACDANTPTPIGTAAIQKPTKIVGFGGAGELIMPRVDYFAVQFGVKNEVNKMAYYTINQYRSLAKTARASGEEPPRIVSVKLGVLVRSTDTTRSKEIKDILGNSIDVLNQTVNLTDQDTEFARRVYSTVVTFRNGLGER